MTRYYPSTKAPGISNFTPGVFLQGPLRGSWGVMGASSPVSPVRERYVLQRVKEPVRPGDEFDQIRIFMTSNQTNNYDFAPDWTWVTRPLQAQVISGTFDLCFKMCIAWLAYTTPISGNIFTDTIAKIKLHIYIARGDNFGVRSTLLNNYIDPNDLPKSTVDQWVSLAAPVTLTPGVVVEGDRIVIEMGVRIIQSRTPTVEPPSEWNRITLGYLKTSENFPDATILDVPSLNRSPWIEFSADIQEVLTVETPPANDSCALAITIPSLPYTSPYLDSTLSTDASNGLWWKWTAEQGGPVSFFLHGSNINASIQIYTGVCGFLSLARNEGPRIADDRSYAITTLPRAVQGVTYYIKVADDTIGFRGGVVRLSALYPQSPKADDLILVANTIFMLREGQYVNISNHLINFTPTGVGADYTNRPMKNLITSAIHQAPRLLFGIHDYEVVEILDASLLGEGGPEIDYIGNPVNWFVSGKNIHMGQLHVTAAGRLFTGWFGDGYKFVGGKSLQGHLSTTFLNAPASFPEYTAIKSIDATHGENQENAPFPDREHLVQTTLSAWAFTIDEAAGIAYYVTGGMYIPVGTHQTIKRYDVVTNTQLADFATIPPSGPIPGLKGLRLLFTVGGAFDGLLVCNGDRVHRVSAAGVVVGTYIPSIPQDSTLLIDLALSVDKSKFWVVDQYSTRVYKFDVTSGLELLNFQPFGNSSSVVQMMVYNPPVPAVVLDRSGLHVVNPKATRDTYNTETKKIPNPAIRTAFFGE